MIPSLTNAPPATPAPTRAQYAMNLLTPGAGLLLIGAWGHGLLFGAVFWVFSLLSVLWIAVIPYEPPPWAVYIVVVLTIAVYVAAQFKLAQTVREQAAAAHAAMRRAALITARRAMASGDPQTALRALEPLQCHLATDLLVAVRAAEALAAAGDHAQARTVWELVLRTDRHGLYRATAHRALVALAGAEPHSGPRQS